MALDVFLTLLGLALAAAWTPGPNSAMLASSGATWGIRATLPHILGIGVGFPFMIFCIAMGLSEVFKASPLLQDILRWGSGLVMIWFAWKIANASAPGSGGGFRRPFTFAQSAGFQWINPKAWIMSIAITAQFVIGDERLKVAIIVSLVFVFAGFSSAFGWATFGRSLQRWLNTPTRLAWFNRSMAALILLFFAMLMFGN